MFWGLAWEEKSTLLVGSVSCLFFFSPKTKELGKEDQGLECNFVDSGLVLVFKLLIACVNFH